MHVCVWRHFIKTRLNPFFGWSRPDSWAWPLTSQCRLPKPKPMQPRCKLKGSSGLGGQMRVFDSDLWSFCSDSLCHWSGLPQWEGKPGAPVPLETKCEAGAGPKGAWPLGGARLERLHHGKHIREDSLASRIRALSAIQQMMLLQL